MKPYCFKLYIKYIVCSFVLASGKPVTSAADECVCKLEALLDDIASGIKSYPALCQDKEYIKFGGQKIYTINIYY